MIWLKIIARKRLEDCGEFSAAISECNELIAIFVSSTETADGNGWFSQSDINNHQFPIPSFPTPPVTAAVLESEINSFATAKAAQAQGGTAATAAKNNARGTLTGLLQQLAFYVQVTSNDDLALLLSTGFEPVSQNRTQTQLAKPTLIRIKNGLSGQSLATISPDRNARCAQLIVAEIAEIDETGAPGPFRPPIIHTSSVNIPVDDLTPGKLYAMQGRFVGGLTGFSDWSDVVTHRAA